MIGIVFLVSGFMGWNFYSLFFFVGISQLYPTWCVNQENFQPQGMEEQKKESLPKDSKEKKSLLGFSLYWFLLLLCTKYHL